MAILPSSPNTFGGIVIDPERLPADAAVFRDQLAESLPFWRTDGYKVAWLEVPIGKSALIPIAVDSGFTFHHTTDDYLLLTLRLAEGAFIPTHATHYIGAGGVVLNSRRELLVVCEKYRRTSRPYYKLPGGALQPGEHLVEAVEREVFEETGVRARFESLVCLRHWHGYRYGKSDIYFVCRLAPLSEDVNMQAEELDECLWMPVENYFGSELVSPFNKRIVHAALTSPGVVPTDIEGYTDPTKYEIFMPRNGSDA
jgi:8-oxo-dGTP pyrophosphatase MutT (NUDIX family)